MSIQVETIEFKKSNKELDVAFPLYMAGHRKYTYAKFEGEYFEGEIYAIHVIVAEYGFNLQPSIERKRFGCGSKGVVVKDFESFFNDFEQSVTEEEFWNHFEETLAKIKSKEF